jgi:putative peptidoglycan lipid II flippase
MVILSVPIVQLLLQHGKFHADDTALAASALMVYGIGIFAWSMQSILSRSFYALQDSVTPVVIGTLVTLIFIPMNLLFMNTFQMGIEGLALATTIAATLHVIVMLWVLRNRLHGFELGAMLISVAKTTLASALGGLACWSAKLVVDQNFISPESHVKIHAALSVMLGFGVGCIVFIVCVAALRMDEMKQALLMLRRKTRKAI